MSLFKKRQLFSEKQPPDPHLQDHLEREIDHRERVLREKQQAVEERMKAFRAQMEQGFDEALARITKTLKEPPVKLGE